APRRHLLGPVDGLGGVGDLATGEATGETVASGHGVGMDRCLAPAWFATEGAIAARGEVGPVAGGGWGGEKGGRARPAR
ncbi:MAG: hypothetical protein ACKOGA_18355, partial [Planctomycetaceae bacterium]